LITSCRPVVANVAAGALVGVSAGAGVGVAGGAEVGVAGGTLVGVGVSGGALAGAASGCSAGLQLANKPAAARPRNLRREIPRELLVELCWFMTILPPHILRAFSESPL
jgi:hypothetical protein